MFVVPEHLDLRPEVLTCFACRVASFRVLLSIVGCALEKRGKASDVQKVPALK